MNIWCLDILRKRDGKLTLCVRAEPSDRVESEEISSTARRDVVAALRKIAGRLARPDVIHTDHARCWSGIAPVVGASHRICSLRAESRLSLLYRRFRAEDRA